jgi:hypothetical protein
MSLYFIGAYPNRTEPSLYEYVSFNIRKYYCVHKQLIYYQTETE